MKPLNIENFNQEWDCIVPPEQLSLIYSQQQKNKPSASFGIALYSCAVILAIVAAFVSSDILLAISAILAISGFANFLYTEWRRKHVIQIYDKEIIYRKKIETNSQHKEIFSQALDNADDLAEISLKHSFIASSVANSEINASLWQCAQALASNETAVAKSIVKDLKDALSASQNAVESIESSNMLDDSDAHARNALDALTTNKKKHSLILKDSAQALEKGAQEINQISKRQIGE